MYHKEDGSKPYVRNHKDTTMCPHALTQCVLMVWSLFVIYGLNHEETCKWKHEENSIRRHDFKHVENAMQTMRRTA